MNYFRPELKMRRFYTAQSVLSFVREVFGARRVRPFRRALPISPGPFPELPKAGACKAIRTFLVLEFKFPRCPFSRGPKSSWGPEQSSLGTGIAYKQAIAWSPLRVYSGKQRSKADGSQ